MELWKIYKKNIFATNIKGKKDVKNYFLWEIGSSFAVRISKIILKVQNCQFNKITTCFGYFYDVLP